jgi:hypothetical protein
VSTSNIAAAVTATVTPALTQTELEMEAGRKASERHAGHRAASTKKANGPPANIPFPFFVKSVPGDTGIVAAVRAKQAQAGTIKRETLSAGQPAANPGHAKLSGIGLPMFDYATAIDFYNAVRPSAFIFGYADGRNVATADKFQSLIQEADGKRENLFFHVAALKPEWADPRTHEKGKITTASKEKAVNMADGSASHVRECLWLWRADAITVGLGPFA